jgi:hypothetical protein
MSKCSECGLLAARIKDTREIQEVEQEWRETGEPPLENNHAIYEYPPFCLMSRAKFGSIPKGLNTSGVLGWDKLFEEFQKERECGDFTRWCQGYSPKEHQEMLEKTQLLKWQERQETRRLIIGAIIAGAFTIIGAVVGAALTYLITR